MSKPIECHHIHAALKPNFIWQKEPRKPLQIVKDDNTNSVGMAVTIFIGLSILYGIDKADAMQYLDITHQEYRTKLKRFKKHIYTGLLNRLFYKPGEEKTIDDRYLMKYEMCKRYIDMHFKQPGFLSIDEIFTIE